MDIQYLLFLQNIRNHLPTFVSKFMMFVSDAALLLEFLIPMFLYWCISKRKAIFVAYTLGFSSILNQLLKNIFCIYRPWIRDARIQPFGNAKFTATGYSFPSGHSQIASATFGGVAYCYWKEKFFVNTMIFIALLVGFSRNFLGCHTPQDVFFGLCEGAAFVVVMHFLLGWTWSKKEREKFVVLAGIVFAVAMLVLTELKPYPIRLAHGVLLVDPEKMKLDCYRSAGMLVGILLGIFLEQKFVNFEIEVPWIRKTLRFTIGSAVAAGLFIGLSLLFFKIGLNQKVANFITTFSLMFFIFFLGPLAIKTLNNFQK